MARAGHGSAPTLASLPVGAFALTVPLAPHCPRAHPNGLRSLRRSCGAEMVEEWIGGAFPELGRENEDGANRDRHAVRHPTMNGVSLPSAMRQPTGRDIDNGEQSAGEKN